VAISDSNKLTLDFKEKLKWPPSQQQLILEKHIVTHATEQRCAYCLEFFSHKMNESNACGRHISKWLYDEEFINKLREKKKDEENYDPFTDPKLNTELYMKTRDQVIDMLNDKSNPKLVKKGGNFKWICCGKAAFEKGELKERHSAVYKD